MHRQWMILMLMGLVALSACSSDDKKQDVEPFKFKENNKKTVDMTDMTPDVSEDMPPEDMVKDMPKKRVRKLIRRSLFGQMPLNNRFKDPLFNGLGRFDWLIRNPRSTQFEWKTHYRKEIWESPTKMPILHVPKTGTNQIEVFGTFHLSRQAAQVSVWVGRVDALAGESSWPKVSIYGLDVTNVGNFQGVDLDPADQSEEKMGNITWRQYKGVVSNFAGYAYLSILDNSPSALYVQSPIAYTLDISPQGLTQHKVLKRRQVGARVQEVLRDLMKRQRTPVPKQRKPALRGHQWPGLGK